MARRFTYETTLAFGNYKSDEFRELDVKASYAVAWGSPELGRWGPPENYDPGSASIVEDVRVEAVEGYSAVGPQFAAEIVQKLESEHDEMILAASERLEGEREDAEESRWREFREGCR